MSTSSKSSASSVKGVISDARRLAEKRKTGSEKTAPDESFQSLTQTNVFARIMLNPELSPEAKRDETIKALAFSKEATKEENRAKLEAFEQFKAYLQEQRKILNREGIKLQDTEAFAELQSVIDDMTRASIAFQERAKPLIDVLTAVFEIRKQDKITEVYKEIENDKAWQQEQAERLQDLEQSLKSHENLLDGLEREQARLAEDKSLFGLGPIRREARERINEIENVDKPKAVEAISATIDQIAKQKAAIEAGRGAENPELLEQKAILREFLDLGKDENRERQKALIRAAVEYVDTSDERLKSVLNTLDRLGKHAEVVNDTNGMLRNVYLITDEALKKVNLENDALKKGLVAAPPDESSIARMAREEKLKELNEHITVTDDAAVDVTNSIGGLTKHAVQVDAYKETLRNETTSTKRLHLEGVSQMGEQLMSVISAISAAATTESRSIAANNFAKMAEQNQTIVTQEVVRNATSIELEANQIAKLVGELQDYGEVLTASSQIAADGYSRMRETVDAIRKVSGSVQSAINDLISDRADAQIASGQGDRADAGSGSTEEPEKAAGIPNPFDRLQRL